MEATEIATHCSQLQVLDKAMISMLSTCSKELEATFKMALEVCAQVAKGNE